MTHMQSRHIILKNYTVSQPPCFGASRGNNIAYSCRRPVPDSWAFQQIDSGIGDIANRAFVGIGILKTDNEHNAYVVDILSVTGRNTVRQMSCYRESAVVRHLECDLWMYGQQVHHNIKFHSPTVSLHHILNSPIHQMEVQIMVCNRIC